MRELTLGTSGRFAIAAAPVVAAFLVTEWLVLAGEGSFAGAISFVGAIGASILAGIFPVLLLRSSRCKGEYVPVPVYRRLGNPALLGAVYGFFLAGVVLHGLVIWDDPVERGGALLAAAVIVAMTAIVARRGGFARRLAIELREDKANETANFAITGEGRRIESEVRLRYDDREQRVRAAEGQIYDFGALRRASFEPRWRYDGARELKVWAHSVTPEGESEALQGRPRAELDHRPGHVELDLSRGQAVLTPDPFPDTVEIVLGGADRE